MELTRLESVPESPPSRRRVPYTQARRQPWWIGPAGGIPRSTVIAFDSCVSRESQPKLRVVGVDDHILLHDGVLLGMFRRCYVGPDLSPPPFPFFYCM